MSLRLAPLRRSERGQSWHQPVEEENHVREQLGLRKAISELWFGKLAIHQGSNQYERLWQHQLPRSHLACRPQLSLHICWKLLMLPRIAPWATGAHGTFAVCLVVLAQPPGSEVLPNNRRFDWNCWMPCIYCNRLSIRPGFVNLLAHLSLTRHLVVLHVRISPRHISAIQVIFAPWPMLDLWCFSYSNIFQLWANNFVVHCPEELKAVAPLKWDDEVYLLFLFTVLESWSTFS